MQVLKFGGSSVANAENIEKVVSIIQKAVLTDKTVVVLSALGGATDLLLESGELAAAGDESYKEKLRTLEQRHLEAESRYRQCSICEGKRSCLWSGRTTTKSATRRC